MEWVIEVNRKLEDINGAWRRDQEMWKKQCIYKVPSLFLDLNKRAYTPQAVSFGPYHNGKAHLGPLEDHKQRALLHFFHRSSVSLESVFKSLLGSAQELIESYGSFDWKESRERFVEMIFVDGCFMLEILRAYKERGQVYDDYDAEDAVFGRHGKLYVMPFVRRDMLLLENQLPMLVLLRLSGITTDNQEGIKFLNKLILGFCNPTCEYFNMGKCLHVLDLYRKSLLLHPSLIGKPPSIRTRSEGDDTVVRSASELHEAGIRFHKSKTNSLRDISFKGGVLTLPTFVVDDTTESTFLNLIAFERCHVGAGHEVTSYIFLMDNIVDHARDISLLSSREIIQNVIGSDKTAANLINTMSKDLTMDPDSDLTDVQCRIASYCKKPWNKWRANLFHTYFTSPWAIISVIAAILLFGLTIIQTIYSVLDYNQSPKCPCSSPPKM